MPSTATPALFWGSSRSSISLGRCLFQSFC